MGGQKEGEKSGRAEASSLSIGQALELAMGLHQNGVLDAAEELYGRIPDAAPDQVDALHLLGLSRHQRGAHEDALALLRRAVALAPDHASAHNNLGNMLFGVGDVEGAEAAYRRALELRPSDASAHANVGVVLRRKDDLPGAEAAFRRALELEPEHGEALHNLGGVLRDTDRSDEALETFRRALELRPYDGESYRRLGATLYAVGRVADAAAIYRRWLELEPANAAAQHMLASCSGERVPARASDAFVQRIFDSFASTFDSVLERLRYRAPALVVEALGAAVGAPGGDLDVLDAGVGTGLCGPGLRPYARHLAGVDLSPLMLAKARAGGLYDALETGELVAYMRAHPAAFDVVISADTLVYFGALGEALAAAAAATRAGGHLVFTLERLDEPTPEGFRLNPHGRYSHAEAYISTVVAQAGFTLSSVTPVELRSENKLPVHGFVVSAHRG